MKIKLNRSQQKKFNSIVLYLDTDMGKSDGIILYDNDSTYISKVEKLYINATGICLRGFNFCGTVRFTDRFDSGADITRIFRAGLKGDEDFKYFVEMEEFND